MNTLDTYPQIEAVIFDLDGVITNTVDFHYLSWQRLTQEEGIPFDEQIHEGMLGLNREDSLKYLWGERLEIDEKRLELLNRKNDYYLELIEQLNAENLLPGIKTLLQDLQAAHLKIGLGSSSKNAEIVLRKLGIIHFFDRLADGHSVAHSKPAPDVFLHAADLLGVAPDHCLAIEDAAAGVAAALAAGMWVVGVGSYERLHRAHVVLPSLGDMSWENLLAKIAYYHHDRSGPNC
jgi:beta-phosphoglucomutase